MNFIESWVRKIRLDFYIWALNQPRQDPLAIAEPYYYYARVIREAQRLGITSTGSNAIHIKGQAQAQNVRDLDKDLKLHIRAWESRKSLAEIDGPLRSVNALDWMMGSEAVLGSIQESICTLLKYHQEGTDDDKQFMRRRLASVTHDIQWLMRALHGAVKAA